MCGIAGIYSNFENQNYRKELIQHMIKTLNHRGPDEQGTYIDSNICFGHARLSIVDLHSGKQPIFNEDKTVCVIFNGEIFNYIELRKDLKAKGHIFKTNTDTEVIAHLYEEAGESFVEQLNGQFAIALWDLKIKKLLLVRDRPGIAPLFFTQSENQFIFASEIKAILPALPTPPKLSIETLDQIMTMWSPIGDRTVFENIYQILPGEMLIIKSGIVSRKKYWQWGFPQHSDYDNRNEEELTEELSYLLDDAVQLRLRADVPVGAYLSGGLDSSITASLLCKHKADVSTFSIKFEDDAYDESKYQKQMIESLDINSSSVCCSNDDIANNIEKAIWHTESPIVRTAPIPMMLLSKHVRENNYKVVLTGEGADEVFGGYDIFKELKLKQFCAKNPGSKFRTLLLKRLYPYLDISSKNSQAILANIFGDVTGNKEDPFYSHQTRIKTTSGIKMFLRKEYAVSGNQHALAAMQKELPPEFSEWEAFCKAQYLEARTLMPNYILSSQGDRMLLANSVEGRFPFLDHRIIEFANKLHPKLKMKVLNEKYLLKKSMQHQLPNEIVNRYKQPYQAPTSSAFYNNKLAPIADDLLSNDKIKKYAYFDAKKLTC